MNQTTIVFAIILLIWLGVFGYLVSLDGRIRKLEKGE